MLHFRYQLFFASICFLLVIISNQALAAGDSTTLIEEHQFKGICDGSAAVALDDTTMIVTYDESNLLAAYHINETEYIPRIKRLSRLLNLPAARTKEIDIEGAAIGDDRIWWVGSQSLTKQWDDDPNRKLLFSTTIPRNGLDEITISDQISDLTEVLLDSPEVAAILDIEVLSSRPKEGGINIEGLAINPGGGLVVGFRSPLSDHGGMTGKALIVRLNKVSGKGSLQVTGFEHINLDDRGVRDIVWTGEGYVILAGPVSRGGIFSLYSWDGQTAPRIIETDILDGLNPEALVHFDDRWMVLSDDGKIKRQGYKKVRTCDKIYKKATRDRVPMHDNVYFRARSFTMQLEEEWRGTISE